MKERLRILFISVGIMLILAMLTVAGWFFLKPAPLVFQGEVEATQIEIASKIAGRVDSLFIKEGESVIKGQLLVSIKSPEIQAKLKQATAAERAASAQQEKAYRGPREEEIQAALNVWQRAVSSAELAEKTYKRIESLHIDGVVPTQKLDEAEAQLKAAREAGKATKATYDMAIAGVRDEDKDAATALLDQASGVVSEVEAYLQETRLVAPIGGEVVDIIADPGELISPGYPVVSLVNLDDIWVSFYLREDWLSNVKMGDSLTVQIPALGNQEVKLKVNYISALGDFATWHATKSSGDFDLKTFEIRAIPLEIVTGLRPGMSAILTYDRSR